MKRHVANASLWAVVGSGTQYATVFGILVYLARVLEPRDFGLMATVSIGLDLGLQVARWGQVELLQQQRYRNDAARNRSLRLSMLLGLFLAILFAALAHPAAQYFQSAELATMFYLCAPIFPLSAASILAEAIMRSEFRFRQLALRNTLCTVLGGAAAVACAAAGYGAVTLAIQRLVQVLLTTIWVWASIDWRPALRSPRGEDQDLIGQGASVMVGSILPLLVPRSVDLFVGTILGPVQLGLMRVAYRLNDLVGQIVVLPLVSVATAQLSRDGHDLERLRLSYLGLTQLSAALMCPSLVGLALIAPEAVPALFGPHWIPSVPLVQILSLLAFVAPINYHFTAVMVAVDASRVVLRQGAFQVVFGLALAAVAAQYSLAAVVAAHVVRGIVVGLTNAFDLRKFVGLTFRRVAAGLAPIYACTVIMAAAMVLARWAFAGLSDIERLVVITSTGVVAFCVAALGGALLGFWPSLQALAVSIINRRFAAL